LTNRIALWLAILIALACAADLLAFGGASLVFLGRRLIVLLDWLAFWR
jgi:hypothetical protein